MIGDPLMPRESVETVVSRARTDRHVRNLSARDRAVRDGTITMTIILGLTLVVALIGAP